MLLLQLLSRFSHVRLLCDPRDGSPPGSPIPGILQARTLEWVAISFSPEMLVPFKSTSEVTQSCPTPRDPMDCSLPGSSIHGICQARVLEWVATAFSPEMLVPFKSTLHHLNSFQFLNRKTLLHTCIIGCLASLHSICKDSFDSKCFHISKYLYVKEPSELPKNSLQDVMQTVKD